MKKQSEQKSKRVSREQKFRTPLRKEKVKQLGVRPQYVLVFDYDHTLTNSYGNGNHSNGISYDNYNIGKTKTTYRRDTTKFIENYKVLNKEENIRIISANELSKDD